MGVVIPDHDCCAVSAFVQSLNATHWKVTSWVVYYPNIGNSIADLCTIMTAIHTSCASTVNPIELKTPPPTLSRPLSSFLWEQFNRPKHSVCLNCYDSCFNKDDSPKMVVIGPCPASELGHPGICILYHLDRDNSDSLILAGSSVLSHGSLCLQIEPCSNQNHSRTILAFNLTTIDLATFAESQHTNLLDALAYRTRNNIACLTRSIGLPLMHPCPVILWHGCSNRSICTQLTSGMQIVRSFPLTNLQCLWQ